MSRFPTASIALAAALLCTAPARADDGFAGFASASKAVDFVLSTKPFGERNLIYSSTAPAALQIAIWEIACESRGGSAAGSGALALASAWLGDLSGSSPSGYSVETLDSVNDPGRPDVVLAAAVPEPSSYAVLAGGLFAIGLVSRRRAARARA